LPLPIGLICFPNTTANFFAFFCHYNGFVG
jgi:hypothetical protein